MAATAPAKAASPEAQPSAFKSFFAGIAIIVLFILSIVIYVFVLGNPANFEGGDPANHPVKDNYLGVVYKGGVIVPILMTCFLIVITFSIERFLTLSKASGTGSIDSFIRKIKGFLNTNNIQGAMAECDKQKGSVGAVMRAGLEKYKTLANDNTLDKETKVNALKQELEEASALEMPMLSKNLVILSTSASLGVLIGLLGTVSGMIKSFSAMAAGVPDPAQLSVGISEALVNTFLGILASALAILLYSFFSNKIDQLTYGIDEAGFSIAQTFASKH
jgi:biopolymer transport protein ExbB